MRLVFISSVIATSALRTISAVIGSIAVAAAVGACLLILCSCATWVS